jgi:prepilin-type N-terminal cleavage/methylation domain-containing protein
MYNFLKRKNNQKGFTLIELLVVIGIIAVLAAIAIPQFQNSQATSRGAKIISDLRTLDSALVQYAAAGNTDTPVVGATSTLVTGGYLATFPTPPTGSIVFPVAAENASASAIKVYGIGTVGTNTQLRGTFNSLAVESFVNN